MQPDQIDERPRVSTRTRWMSRLAGSFIVVAVVLFGLAVGYPKDRPPLPDGQRLVCGIAAGISLALGVSGLRIRRKLIRRDL